MLAPTLVHLLRDNFIEAKVRGKKSFLLERQQLLSLAEFSTQSEILGFLADSAYGPELSKLQETSSPVEVEQAVRQSFARSVRSLISSSKGGIEEFLKEYTRRFDAYNLGTLLLFKSQGKTWEEYFPTRQPLSALTAGELHRLFLTESLEDLGRRFGDDTLRDRLAGISVEEMTPDKVSLIRDIFSGWGEERFYNYVRRRLSGSDRRSCMSIVGATIDLLNLSIVLRSKLLGIANVREHLVPVHWRVGRKQLTQMLSAETLSEILDRASSLGPLRGLLSGARLKYDESKSLAFLEVAVRDHIVGVAREVMLKFPHTVGVVLAFLTLKENEARNLAAVVSGVGAGLRPETIRPLLVA